MTPALLSSLKESAQDFEFYPTTAEIIRAMVQDLKALEYDRDRHTARWNFGSVLDIGAGNGKVLRALQDSELGFHELYAIEKSEILRQQLGADIFVVGTEFQQQSLLSKQVDVIFSNPPYSVFAEWAVKIFREAASRAVYLVLPIRWQDSRPIAEALAFRGVQAHVVGSFDFETAEDRAARARVQLLRVVMAEDQDDAFERFFEETFSHLRAKFTASAEQAAPPPPKFSQLAVGESYPETMVNLYNQEMAHIQRTYELVGELDVTLLKELGVSPALVMQCIKTRLAGLRNLYWKEIFDRMSAITDRLTTKKRATLLDTLSRHAHVDFTVDNIFAVILWVIKNANQYLDAQLIETFERMVEKANVRLYVSNRRPFTWDRWRYAEDQSRSTHFALEYRLVLASLGGIRTGYSFERGLSETACEFLSDLLTVARNLGFNCQTNDHRLWGGRQNWESNQLKTFYFAGKPKPEVLFEVRAFKNGNTHIRMHQRLALALNVEYGRLKGWLKSGEEAATELNDLEAARLFRSNLALPTSGNPVLLLAAA